MGRHVLRIRDKMQLIASFLWVRKARAFGKRTEPTEKSAARRCGEVRQKELERSSSLARVRGESPCLQASTKTDPGSGKGTCCRSDSRAGEDG